MRSPVRAVRENLTFRQIVFIYLCFCFDLSDNRYLGDVRKRGYRCFYVASCGIRGTPP